MKTKENLLKKIDVAINDENTTSENRELLKEARLELEKAKTKSQYWDVVLKVANIIGAITKIFSGSG